MPYQKNVSPSQDLSTKRCTLSRKRKTKFTRKSVLKMLAVMAASQNYETGPSTSSNTTNNNNDGGGGGGANKFQQDVSPTTASPDGFLQTGRTGRRNALADILSEHACFTTSDLPNRLQKLTTTDNNSSSNNTDGGNCSKTDDNS